MMPRRAREGEDEALAVLDEACFAPAERWSRGLWADELAAADRLVVVQADDGDAEVVAAATFQHVPGAESVDLHRVMVRPSHRGLGLARQLVAAGAEWALDRTADRMLLEVRHDNHDARRLYEGLGFATIDTRPDYYSAGAHALVMQAALPLRQPAQRQEVRP